MINLRRSLLAALAALTLGVLAACGPSTNTSPEPSTPAVEQPTESVMPTVAP